MPKVSIVVCCYNQEKTIACCVNSLLRQSFADLEVIVVNDGSTDRTETICEKLRKRDDRVKLISKNNEGRMLARYTGYKEASGEFVVFTDGDDYHPRTSIECLYELAEKNQVDCVVGNCYRVFGSFPWVKKKRTISIAGALLRGDEKWRRCFGYANNNVLGDHLPGEMWARIYKKSCIDKAVAADPARVFQECLLEDWWFNLTTMAYLDSMYITDEPVYYYRCGGSSEGDYPFLERSNEYFNYRYSYFNSLLELDPDSSRDELLMRTFICFVECLIKEARLKVGAHKYSDMEICAFIDDQLSCNSIIKWMSNHADMVPLSYKKKAILAIEKDSNGILAIAKSHYEQLRSRRIITGPIIRTYDGLCDVVERLFGGIQL